MLITKVDSNHQINGCSMNYIKKSSWGPKFLELNTQHVHTWKITSNCTGSQVVKGAYMFGV